MKITFHKIETGWLIEEEGKTYHVKSRFLLFRKLKELVPSEIKNPPKEETGETEANA
jgi:hypothetical protein